MRKRSAGTDAARRERVLDGAIAAGKFLPSRRSHYAAMYDADPHGTERLIEMMAGAPGALAAGAVLRGAEGPTGYDESLLTASERASLAQRRTAAPEPVAEPAEPEPAPVERGRRRASRTHTRTGATPPTRERGSVLDGDGYPPHLLSGAERETIASAQRGIAPPLIAGDAAGGIVPTRAT